MPNIAVRGVEAAKILRQGGPRLLAKRVSRAAVLRLGASDLDFPLDFDDIADSRSLDLAVPRRCPSRGTPLTVGWICTPPGPGSGGHTTLFRMVEAVEAAGHECVLYLYDRFNGQRSRHEQTIRRHWPGIRAEIRFVAEGLRQLDAYVASSWQTAHVLATKSHFPTRRLYLIQDFEPYFYPQGSEYALAEDTYRFGFHCVALGWFVADLLRKQFNVSPAFAEHGCDTSVYELKNEGARTGVAFYAKPGVARRGFELGMLALREFSRRKPGYPVHIFGDASVAPLFPATNHGSAAPEFLSHVYNNCRVGLAMSFTNVSLVPAEMLACGVVPVMCGTYTRNDLDNPFLQLAEPNPTAIAEQLCLIADSAQPSPAEVAGSIRMNNWSHAQRVCLQAIEDAVYGRSGG